MSLTIDCGCTCCALSGEVPCSQGCCKCPCTGDVSFDILDCQAYTVVENPIDGMDNWAPIDSCCTGMTFGLKKEIGYQICSMAGHGPGQGTDSSGCLTTGTGPGMPTGTGIDSLPELWGFTGTVCGDCMTGPPRPPGADPMTGWHEPHFAASGCDGMCVRASLCCCTTPSSGSGASSRCGAGGDPALPRKPECRCNTSCYKFTMEPFDCHEIPNSVICPPMTGTTMSACSPCSYIEGPVQTGEYHDPAGVLYTGCAWDCDTYSDETGSAMGGWNVWANCLPDVARESRQCGVTPYTGSAECSGQCPNTGGGTPPNYYNTQLMLLVDGVYQSQCDCATGEFYLLCPGGDGAPPPIYTPSGVGVLREVYVKFTGLLSQSC
jgi:hypothetical protein